MEELVPYFCKSCNKDVEIGVTIYSHDEFFCDDSCPDCNAKIPTKDQDRILEESVTGYISGRIDYATDYLRDR